MEDGTLVITESISTSVVPLSGGEAGTLQTVASMIQIAQSESATEAVRMAAEDAVRGVTPRNYRAEARAVERWVRDHIRYTRDGLRVETLKTPLRMLNEIRRYGKTCADCDDSSILTAALLLAIGHAPAFEVVGRGEVPQHVMVYDHTAGITLDSTIGETITGENFNYRKLFDVVPMGFGSLGALDAASLSSLERYLPLLLIGRMILKGIRRGKNVRKK